MAERDIVIVGAGAAGLSAALYAAEEDMDVLLVEQLASGGTQLLVESLSNFPGAGRIPGYELSQRMEAQAAAAGAKITNDTVTAVRHGAGDLTVETAKTSITASAVILCTGTEPRPLGVPGEAELAGKGVSSCASCDGPLFRDKRVLVVGGGDSACDEALFLAGLARRVLLVNRREAFSARAALARRAAAVPNIEVRHETEVVEILGPGTVTGVRLLDRASGRTATESVEGVFIFVGSFPRMPAVAGLSTDEGGYLVTDHRMATNVPGVYAAGAVRSGTFRQSVVAAGEGAVAAHSAAAHVRSTRRRAAP